MAPLPDNDKAPDKQDKNKQEKLKDKSKGSQKDEKTLSNLNDRELKALLDEAITYKNPKDREGKSDLFRDLLLEAEETERIARATSAGGSELVRHCNPAARRQRHNGGPRVRRYGAPVISGLMGRSVSERGTHGGSLDNLGKEELYEAGCRRLRGERKSSTSSSGTSSNCLHNQVSSRQREGGSLPCNVNSGDSTRDFFDDTKRHKDVRDRDLAGIDAETDYLLENDHLQRSYEERLIQVNNSGSSSLGDSSTLPSLGGPKFTTSPVTTLLNVEDSKILERENGSDKSKDSLTKMKVDENGNALHQPKEKKKKKQTDKNVVVVKSENIEGHKFEIIDDVEELVHYIEGTKENPLKPRSLPSSKSKQFHKQHNSEDGASRANRKRHPKAYSKENGSSSNGRHELKKSNSLGEISEMKLGRDFEGFGRKNDEDGDKVILRTNKGIGDRTRERRSWGTVETPAFQTFYNASSLENLETAAADNWVVTRPKKKSKKRRNSVSSASAARQNSSTSVMSSSISNEERRSRRAPSPDLGVVIVGSNVKTTRSMPHSEKSNDSSSDVDSVHSLPMDGPISYADIAKNSEKKKQSPEKQERPLITTKEKSPQIIEIKHIFSTHGASSEKTPNSTLSIVNTSSVNKNVVPDVHNIKSFPAITGTVSKTSTTVINTTVSHHSGTITMTSDKAVQSTLLFEESFVNEKSPVSSAKTNSVDVTLQTTSLEAILISEIVSSSPISTDPTHSAPINSTSTLNAPVSSKKQALSTGNMVKTKPNKDNGKTNVPNRDTIGTQQNQILIPSGKLNEVQNNLPFFSQLMRDPAQYATQKMPPDIMDVTTIEKLHFMNCSSPQNLCSPTGTPNNSQVSYTQLSNNTAQRDSVNSNGQGKSKRKKGGNGSKGNCIKDENGLSSVCDNNLGERDVCSILNGVSDETFSSPEPSHRSSSPPPVIILSGRHKEVPSGLVFGFDINEQLLLEDSGGGGDINLIVNNQNISENTTEIMLETSPCKAEEWAKLFKPPSIDKCPSKQSHDKVVSFISTAWEEIVSQNVQYYSDEL